MVDDEKNRDLAARARLVRLAIFDVDGVLTDGRLFFLPDGSETKIFHARDGMGFRLLRDQGIEIAIISGRESPVVAKRMAALKINFVFQGCDNKLAVYEELLAKLKLTPEQTSYVGDDIIDAPVMRKAGLAVAVADAHHSAIAAAHWVTALPGGLGAVREVCDFLLASQNPKSQV